MARLTLTADEAASAEALARAEGWVEAADDGNWPLALVALGVATQRLEHALDGLDLHDAAARESLRGSLLGERMRREGRVAPLRFAAFELGRSNRILEIKANALRIDNRGMRLRLGDEAP